jgi:hypothetical protein
MSVRPITDTLRRIGRGAFIDRASEDLAAVVKHVEEHGKPGVVLLEIKVSKANRGGALVVEGRSTPKMGKPAAEDALLWPTPEGNLVDADPAQRELPLREAGSNVNAA